MSGNSSNLINTEELEKDFERHLWPNSNSRIIFSGIFGIGKTSFLNRFFQSRTDDYYVIKLKPINYAVAKNEDVFELIKYDILLQLLNSNPEIERVNFDKGDFMLYYLQNNWDQVVVELLRFAANVASPVTKGISKSLSKLYDKIQKESIALQNESEFEYLKKFQAENAEKVGSIYEFNQISQIIECLVQSFYVNKRTVLLIDDLDRVDPGHIFRLLNVFSAHVDFENSGENKFGFSKIIFVCDINNIRKIFHSQYGLGTDFSGYIDKFSSEEIYEFSMEPLVRKEILNYLKIIQISNKGEFFEHYILHEPFYKSGLVKVISVIMEFGKTNLRKLKTACEKNMALSAKEINFQDYTYIIGEDPAFLFFEILRKCVGSSNELLETFDLISKIEGSKLISKKSTDYSIFQALLYLFISDSQELDSNGGDGDFEYMFDGQNRYIAEYNIGNTRIGRGETSRIMRVKVKGSQDEIGDFRLNIWDFLLKAYKQTLSIKSAL